MKPANKHSAALDACFDELKDFSNNETLGATEDNRFAPYLLGGSQVGSIKLLLHIVNQLNSDNAKLQRQLSEKDADLSEIQKVVDASISYF